MLEKNNGTSGNCETLIGVKHKYTPVSGCVNPLFPSSGRRLAQEPGGEHIRSYSPFSRFQEGERGSRGKSQLIDHGRRKQHLRSDELGRQASPTQPGAFHVPSLGGGQVAKRLERIRKKAQTTRSSGFLSSKLASVLKCPQTCKGNIWGGREQGKNSEMKGYCKGEATVLRGSASSTTAAICRYGRKKRRD